MKKIVLALAVSAAAMTAGYAGATALVEQPTAPMEANLRQVAYQIHITKEGKTVAMFSLLTMEGHDVITAIGECRGADACRDGAMQSGWHVSANPSILPTGEIVTALVLDHTTKLAPNDTQVFGQRTKVVQKSGESLSLPIGARGCRPVAVMHVPPADRPDGCASRAEYDVKLTAKLVQ